ncbi:MAG: RNA recognition motif domain-containing protein [Planctomycetota bacterium]
MTTIFVGNLSYQTSEAELERAFSRYGRVTSVRLIKDRASGSPRGFAFVQMPSMDDAEEAIVRMNGQSIAGRSIAVSEARDKDDAGPSRPSGPPAAPRRSALLDLL